MTDAGRKQLIEDLLLMSDVKHYGPLYRRAAEEIKRLNNELRQLKRDLSDRNMSRQRDTGVAE